MLLYRKVMGLYCHQSVFQLVSELNQYSDFCFRRFEKDAELNDLIGLYQFALFEFGDQERDLHWWLLSNRATCIEKQSPKVKRSDTLFDLNENKTIKWWSLKGNYDFWLWFEADEEIPFPETALHKLSTKVPSLKALTLLPLKEQTQFSKYLPF